MHAIERAWQEALAGQRTRTGVMVHLVPDDGVDDGPVLATEDVEIRPDDTLERLEQRIHATEHRLLVDTIRTLCHRIAANLPTRPDATRLDATRPDATRPDATRPDALETHA